MRQQGRKHREFWSVQLKGSRRLHTVIRLGINLLIVATIGGGLGFFTGAAFLGFLGEGKRREFLAAEMQAVGQSGDGQQIQRQQQKDYELFHG